MHEAGPHSKPHPNFLVHRAEIINQKQKFLTLIENILKNSREEREGISEKKNTIVQESKAISKRQQDVELKFYETMREKNELERQSRQNLQRLGGMKQNNSNAINKQLQSHIELQRISRQANSQTQRAQINSELKAKAECNSLS